MIKYLINEYLSKIEDNEIKNIIPISDWVIKNKIPHMYDETSMAVKFNINEEQYLEFKLRFL